MPRLSVVVATLRRHRLVAGLLDRLESVSPGAFEVLVVADAAEEDPAGLDAAIGTRPYDVRRLRASLPGASAARNLGWREAAAPLVLFLDDDVLPDRDLVAQHLAWHERHPEETTGVLGDVRWARGLRVTPFMRWIEHGMQFDFRNIRGIEAGWGRFYTVNVSLKRSLLERAGGFDETSFPYLYEDLELAYRLHGLGFRLLYNRRARVEHLHATTLEEYRGRMARAAPLERRFVERYPEIEPFFLKLFRHASESPPVRGRGIPLLRVVPRGVPWLGPRVWRSADLYYRQRLAPAFLAAWRESEDARQSEPSAGARPASSSGSRPSGPK